MELEVKQESPTKQNLAGRYRGTGIYEADCKKKDDMINSLKEKDLGLTEKADKLSSLVDR